MEFFDVIRTRRSVRAYEPGPIEPAKLEAVLEAARAAPTACNNQCFRVVVVPTAGRREALARIYRQGWFSEGPYVLLVCSVPAESWTRRDGKRYDEVDAAIVMDHIVLAAAALGLGSCWVANFDPQAASELLGLDPAWTPVACTPLGYPRESPAPRGRRPLAELVIRK